AGDVDRLAPGGGDHVRPAVGGSQSRRVQELRRHGRLLRWLKSAGRSNVVVAFARMRLPSAKSGPEGGRAEQAGSESLLAAPARPRIVDIRLERLSHDDDPNSRPFDGGGSRISALSYRSSSAGRGG